MLRKASASGLVKFHGNVEGNDIFKGTTDIVVCDGFVGNVLLKASEGLATMLAAMPYAVTAKFAFPDRPAVCTIGDGASGQSASVSPSPR